jgi:hypothetical protein
MMETPAGATSTSGIRATTPVGYAQLYQSFEARPMNPMRNADTNQGGNRDGANRSENQGA